MRRILLLGIAGFIWIAGVASAQTKSAPSSQKGVIQVPEATVFQEASFDSDVIGSLSEGRVFDISLKKREGFYRIRLRPGYLGWISEAEIRPITAAQAQSIQREMKKAREEAESEASPEKDLREGKPFDERRYRGLAIESVQFREKTMGKSRREALLFYGIKMSGPGTLLGAGMETESELLFHSGAPSYYESATGNPASGFMLLGNFLFLTQIPQSDEFMPFYGFGPMFRLSHFSATLSDDPTAGNKRSYALDDLAIGAVFNLGATYRFSRYAVRLDGRYYWETQSYTSFGLAFQMEF